MSARFFKLLAGHLNTLEARLGPQPEIDAIRAAVPKLGRPKGAVSKRTKEVEEIVRQWSANGCCLQYGGLLRETAQPRLAEHCGVSLGTIRNIIKRLNLAWKSYQGGSESPVPRVAPPKTKTN